MKHVERRHHFLRECVEQHRLRVPYVRSADNLADFFTKVQPSRVFFPMRDAIMNVPRARGGLEPNSATVAASPGSVTREPLAQSHETGTEHIPTGQTPPYGSGSNPVS